MNRKTESQIVKSDKLVDVGTHKLRIVLSDIAASRYTIVLEAGGGRIRNPIRKYKTLWRRVPA